MKRKQLDKDIIVLLLTTLVMVSTWVGFEVYRAYMKVEAVSGVEEYLETFDPTLDQTYLNKISQL